VSLLLEVKGLTIAVAGTRPPVRVVRDLSFSLEMGESLGIVGESGSGKSMTALALMGLAPRAMQVTGSIRFEGQELLPVSEQAMIRLRGSRIAMIFQEPMTALNPVHRIGRQIAEGLILHEGVEEAAAYAEAARLLDRVGIHNAAERLSAYPHELSGGQRQRVMIAVALACRPELLIADEPTSALDVTVQVQLLELIRDIVRERNMALIVISHDLGVVAELAQRTLVMYGGAAMEEGKTRSLFSAPKHPYTRGLMAALPGRGNRRARLTAIGGSVPPPHLLAPGCPFHGRCKYGDDLCREVPPEPVWTGATLARCYKVERDVAAG
jgi:peptide/nickel transport system ATP-binding protein